MKINMGIIRVDVNLAELTQVVDHFRSNRFKALEAFSSEVKRAVSEAFDQILNAEMSIFLGSREQDENKRNGFVKKEYALKGVGTIEIRVPRDRKNQFSSKIIPKSEVIDPRLKEDLAVLHLSGLSTRTLSLISKRILGVEVSTNTISNSLSLIEERALSWLERDITEKYWALYIDGTNFDIQRRGSIEKEPSLVIVGVSDDNRRSILAIEPGSRENVASWESAFESLIKRGLDPNHVRIGLMDGLPGLESLFLRTFPNSVTGRCWKHVLSNSIAKAPARLRDAFKLLAHKVMYSDSENEARVAFINLKKAMGNDAERAVHCLEKDLDSLLAFYKFEKSLWTSLRTTNCVERVHKEFKRRTKPMEGLGERTLKCILAFTALRLEIGWRSFTINDKRRQNLEKINQITGAVNALFH